MQSFKVGGVILCEIMPYFQKIMRFFVLNETALYTFAYKQYTMHWKVTNK